MTDSTIIDGKAFAARVRETVARDVAWLAREKSIRPGLAVILIGDNPASEIYVRNKVRQTGEAGMRSFEHRLDASVSQSALLELVGSLNADPSINGILVQLPLPEHIDDAAIIQAVDPSKDVDGFHPVNAGLLATGAPALVPCTPLGCVMMLRDRLADMSGSKALIVGRSNIVGKPMAHLLLGENCTVTIAHSRTRDLPGEVGDADILVAAVGRAEMIRGDWIKDGAVVIDVGINRIPAPERGEGKTRLVGDVEFHAARERAGAITPVPGGVGPMTIACLLRNTVTAACRQHRIDPDVLPSAAD